MALPQTLYRINLNKRINPNIQQKLEDRKYYSIVTLYWFSIWLFPRLSDFSNQELMEKIRIDDFLTIFFFVYLLNRRTVLRIVLPRNIQLLLVVWLWFCIISTTLNVLLHGYPIWIGIIFLGKELQYLLFFTFFAVFSSRNPKFTFTIFTIPFVIIIGYTCWQIGTNNYLGYYGIALPFELETLSPSEAGTLSAIIYILFLSLSLNINLSPISMRWYVGILAMTLIAFVSLIMTASRSNIIAAVATSLILTAISFLQSRQKTYIIFLSLFLLICGILLFTQTSWSNIANTRLQYVPIALVERTIYWKRLYYYYINQLYLPILPTYIGFGLGSPSFLVSLTGSLTLGVDNQYVRRLFEVGLLGTSIWFSLLFMINHHIIRCSRHTIYSNLIRNIVYGIGFCILIISVGFEILQVIRVASIIYSLWGILLGLSFISSKNKQVGVHLYRSTTKRKESKYLHFTTLHNI